MVNLFLRERQTFAYLHNPPGARLTDRTMAPDHGFCPEMLDRTKALVLADVCAKPQFASNPVVDRLGVRAYAGAPLILGPTDTVVGSVCVIGTRPMPNQTRQVSRTHQAAPRRAPRVARPARTRGRPPRHQLPGRLKGSR